MRKNLGLVASFGLVTFFLAPAAIWAQTAPTSGTWQQFSALGNSGVVGSAGSGTVVTGDVGSYPTATITNFGPSTVVAPFTVHRTADTVVQAGHNSAKTAYDSLAAQGGAALPGPIAADELGDRTIGPGVYSLGAANLAATKTVTLSGAGIYIFNVATSLTLNGTSVVSLAAGATACNVFWRVGTSAVLNGTSMVGNVFADASITLGGGTVTGRLLAGTGATGSVTMTTGGNTIGGCSTGGCPTITLAPPTLPNGMVGVAYSQTITASGGTGPWTFAVTAGTLPTNVSLTSAGVLAGTPTVAARFSYTIQGNDATSCPTQNASFVMDIEAVPPPPQVCPTIVLSPPTLPNGTVGVAYSQTIVGGNGVAPYSFGVTAGALPAGVILTATGTLTGTPTTAATSTFTVRGTDANGCVASVPSSIVIAAAPVPAPVCPAITLSPSTLVSGRIGVAFSQTIVGSGGAAPYSFGLTAGALPAGLTLTGAGVLAGTPTTAGTSAFTVRGADANNCATTVAYTTIVAAALPPPPVCPVITLAPSTVPNGTVGVAFTQTVTASGGTAPYSFGVTVGALPAGLTLTGPGVLAGTPTIAGTFIFTVRGTDANGCFANIPGGLVIAAAPPPPTVCPAITLTPPALPNGTVGVAYTQTTVGSGGTAPYSFGVTAGALPTGLILTAAGVLAGTPTTVGTSHFTVRGTDANGCFLEAVAALIVAAAPPPLPICPSIAIPQTTLPNMAVGVGYGLTLTASGGTAPYSWGLTAGALPAGMTLTSAGVLAGTPTTAGTVTFTIRATDASGCFRELPYTMTLPIAVPTLPQVFVVLLALGLAWAGYIRLRRLSCT